MALDVSRRDEVERVVASTLERFGRIDILVNNAGIHVAKPVMETTEDEWDRTIDVNLKGAYLCSKAVVPTMKRQGRGAIVNISSNSGLYHPSAMRFTEYTVSKAGMNGLTKALALALGPEITRQRHLPGLDPDGHGRGARSGGPRHDPRRDRARALGHARRRGRRPRSTSPRTRPASSPASCTSSPAGGACTEGGVRDARPCTSRLAPICLGSSIPVARAVLGTTRCRSGATAGGT